jgi:hypothetical protein
MAVRTLILLVLIGISFSSKIMETIGVIVHELYLQIG